MLSARHRLRVYRRVLLHPVLLLVALLLGAGIVPGGRGGAGLGIVQAAAIFDGMSDQELLERAIRIYRQEGDCEWAIRAYHELLSRDTSDHIQVAALYNQAVCFERRLFWDEALANYQELQRRFPNDPAALDACFREGVMLELQGKFARAEQRFRAISPGSPTLTDADRRAIQVQIGWQQLMQSHRRQAASTLAAVDRAWQKLPVEELTPEKFYLGKAHLALSMLLSQYASEVALAPAPGLDRLSLRLARLLGREDRWLVSRRTRREDRLTAAQRHYTLALQQGIPIWISAVHFRLGSDAEAYYQALNAAEPPAQLTRSQQSYYRTQLKAQTREYQVTAAQLYLRGHEQAVAQQDGSAWAHLLELKVKQIEAQGVDSLGGAPPLEVWKGGLGGEKGELIP